MRATLLLTMALLGGCAAGPTVETNSLQMAFVHVPAGRFTMGGPPDEAAFARDFPGLEPRRLGGIADEAPAHEVRLTRAFWLGRTEVTVGQFRAFLRASGHVPESVADGTGAYGFDAARAGTPVADGDAFAGRDRRWSWADPGFPQTDDHPVVNVSWHDAVAMADWLSRTEGRRYRLPTEAEWEYACRAGTRTHWHSGDDPVALAGVANVFDLDSAADWPRWADRALPVHDGWRFTAPVGQFAPNAFGLHDMHGNVWEWVADRHADDAYARSVRDDPQGPDAGHLRVRRGGSWHTWPFYARCGFRNWNTPSTRYVLLGFRLLREDADAPDQ
jgi:formylglycine-generating enzyme required for sulfatase activity